MLIKQIIKFELRGPGPLAVRVLYNWLFSWQNKNLKGKSSNGLLFTAKTLLEAMYLTFPIWTKSLKKLNPKMKDFKRVLDLNCKEKEDWTI